MKFLGECMRKKAALRESSGRKLCRQRRTRCHVGEAKEGGESKRCQEEQGWGQRSQWGYTQRKVIKVLFGAEFKDDFVSESPVCHTRSIPITNVSSEEKP